MLDLVHGGTRRLGVLVGALALAGTLALAPAAMAGDEPPAEYEVVVVADSEGGAGGGGTDTISYSADFYTVFTNWWNGPKSIGNPPANGPGGDQPPADKDPCPEIKQEIKNTLNEYHDDHRLLATIQGQGFIVSTVKPGGGGSGMFEPGTQPPANGHDVLFSTPGDGFYDDVTGMIEDDIKNDLRDLDMLNAQLELEDC